MKMSKTVADQIAQLLNSQNQLTIHYTAEKVLANQDQYIVRFGDNDVVLGTVEVKNVQWYQCEIDHLSVHPDAKRKGVGTWLLQEAEARAKELHARVAQCTIRVGNEASENLFKKYGFVATVTFLNEENGNRVTIYQKIIN